MEGNKLSSQLKKDVRLLIIKERLFKLNESIRNNLIDDSYEFELKELFVDSDWKEVAVWPGNWRLGIEFAQLIAADQPHISKIETGKKGTNRYRIDLSKFQ